MNTPHTLRTSTRLCVRCIMVLAVAGAVQNLADVHFSPGVPGADDDIARADRRFNAVKAVLSDQIRPPHGLVGYISDLDPMSETGNLARFLAQHSMAPLVLVPAPPSPHDVRDPALRGVWQPAPSPAANPEWFTGNFDNTANAPGIASHAGLVVVHDFGEGVMLLRRAPQ